MKKRYFILLIVITSLGIISFRLNNDNYFQIAKNLDIFATMFREINANYVDEIEPEKVVTIGIDAILASLDPYNDYITEAELEDFQTSTTGEYAGIGAVYSVINDRVLITRLHEGYPADRAGLELGDELISVDGNEVSVDNIYTISQVLKGTVNTVTKVVVKKAVDGSTQTLEIKREKIEIKSVPYFGLFNESTGYIKLEEFTRGAALDVKEAVEDLKRRGASRIVLDLRGNGGGLLTEAINISNIFVEKGSEIVATKGKLKELDSVYRAKYDAVDKEIPLAVLIDNGSASASEVVAGVMQDYDRGVLIGRKSFGKGLVQTTRPLVYNTQLKVTTSKYYIPSGRCIQAIDYSGEENPEAQHLEFKTMGGRTVFDGDGLAPDIQVEGRRYSTLAIELLYRGYLFEYAVQFKKNHPEIPPARKFELSDEQYADFISWVKKSSPEYRLSIEDNLDEMIDDAKKDQYYEELESEFHRLKNTIESHKKRDFETFEDEIRVLLNREISGIYYNRRGEIESTFDDDSDLLVAVEVLGDEERYKATLGR